MELAAKSSNEMGQGAIGCQVTGMLGTYALVVVSLGAWSASELLQSLTAPNLGFAAPAIMVPVQAVRVAPRYANRR